MHYLKENHKAGGVILRWFEIYRSQLFKLQIGLLEPA